MIPKWGILTWHVLILMPGVAGIMDMLAIGVLTDGRYLSGM